MNILEEIRKAINTFDPELTKNEDDLGDSAGKDVTIDSYQSAIDGASEPEDLNFSMSNFDDFEDEEDDEEVEVFQIPQKDYEEEPIKEGDRVKKLTRKLTGTVLTIGELVEVEWDSELVTLEYPEELIHSDDPEEVDDELEKMTSLETDPPELVENPEK